MEVSWNMGTPTSSICRCGFSTINHPFWGPPIDGNPHRNIIIPRWEEPNISGIHRVAARGKSESCKHLDGAPSIPRRDFFRKLGLNPNEIYFFKKHRENHNFGFYGCFVVVLMIFLKFIIFVVQWFFCMKNMDLEKKIIKTSRRNATGTMFFFFFSGITIPLSGRFFRFVNYCAYTMYIYIYYIHMNYINQNSPIWIQMTTNRLCWIDYLSIWCDLDELHLRHWTIWP